MSFSKQSITVFPNTCRQIGVYLRQLAVVSVFCVTVLSPQQPGSTRACSVPAKLYMYVLTFAAYMLVTITTAKTLSLSVCALAASTARPIQVQANDKLTNYCCLASFRALQSCPNPTEFSNRPSFSNLCNSNRLHWFEIAAKIHYLPTLCCGDPVGDVMASTDGANVPPLLRQFHGLHTKCRDTSTPYLRTDKVYRCAVSDDEVQWSTPKPDYEPNNYTADELKGKPFADAELTDQDFQPNWNHLDGKVDRRSFTGQYDVSPDGRPLNPMGRTGLQGRGTLGKWGPNHAADPIVTRWLRNSAGDKVTDDSDGKPILQFVAIQRRDSHEWAIPGGMVDPGERISETLRREFSEEAFDSKCLSEADKHKVDRDLRQFFTRGTLIYQGYVDDPRNTDNAWMETSAVNYHDEHGHTVGQFPLQAGDDAMNIKWMNIGHSLKLYASHRQFVLATAGHRGAHAGMHVA